VIDGVDVIKFQNVGVRYGLGPEILHDISLDLEEGSFNFLTGASGAGKSTLLRLMYLAQKPSRGLISLFGNEISTIPRRELPVLRRRIGVVFQNFRLIDHLTTMENVALPLRVSGVSEKQIKNNVLELLSWVGLSDQIDSRPPTLSGGQKQRVAIARAVITRPKLLLADEPTGNVDDQIAMRLMNLFEQLNKVGTTIVLATHNKSLVNDFPYRRLHLSNGTLNVFTNSVLPTESTTQSKGLI
jgi:cell division transport system ATP-binding protein